MKPFPEAVQKAFPCAPHCLPSRPWWVRSGGIDTPRYKRVGEPKVLNDEMVPAVHVVHPAEAHLPRIDAEHPLPHPGFRAGQIWASEQGSSVVLMSTTNKSGWICHNLQGIAPVSLDSLASLYPYLVADPACPHLAPWSPAGETSEGMT